MNLLAVNFHYFRETTYASGIYPVSKENFARQIRTLQESYTIIGQQQLLQWIQSGNTPTGNYCVITFDDGLKEQMDAFNWLRENGLEAIFYVSILPIEQHRVLNVHKLHYVRTQLNDALLWERLQQQGAAHLNTADERAAAEQYKYDDETGRRVKYLLNFKLAEQEKDRIISHLFNELVPDETAFAKTLYMNDSDLRTLADAGMLGSHGYSHVPLARCENPEAEIKQASAYLEKVTGKPVQSFSYPYGSKEAVNETQLSHFAETDIQFAFTMWRGLNAHLQQPLLLNRVDTNDAPGGKSNQNTYQLAR